MIHIINHQNIYKNVHMAVSGTNKKDFVSLKQTCFSQQHLKLCLFRVAPQENYGMQAEAPVFAKEKYQIYQLCLGQCPNICRPQSITVAQENIGIILAVVRERALRSVAYMNILTFMNNVVWAEQSARQANTGIRAETVVLKIFLCRQLKHVSLAISGIFISNNV